MGNVVSLSDYKKRNKSKKRKSTLSYIAKKVLTRVSVLAVAVGGLSLIVHYDLVSKIPIFALVGMILVLVAMTMLVPLPLWWELKKGKQREKWYGDDFKNGIL